MYLKLGWLNAPTKNCRYPVDKLSYPTTACPCSRSRSTRLLPINPAAPVTNACILLSPHRDNQVCSSSGARICAWHDPEQRSRNRQQRYHDSKNPTTRSTGRSVHFRFRAHRSCENRDRARRYWSFFTSKESGLPLPIPQAYAGLKVAFLLLLSRDRDLLFN